MHTCVSITVSARAYSALYVFSLCFASQHLHGQAQFLQRASTTPAPSNGGLGKEEQRAINELLTVVGLICSPILLGLLVGLFRYRRTLIQMLPEFHSNKVTDKERKFFKAAETQKARAEELRTAADPVAEGPVFLPAQPKRDLGPLNDVEAFFRASSAEDDDRSVFAHSSKASASTESLTGRNELDESIGSRRQASKASSKDSKAAMITGLTRSTSDLSEGSCEHAAVHPELHPEEGAPPVPSLGKDFLRLPDESGRVGRKPRNGSKQSTGSRKAASRSSSKSSARSGSKENLGEGGEVKRKNRRLLTS
ncbi:unnamed protein product [Symbiodinium natans]|uniref:Transmembrane protein n=1 Tax=Symbiodinium natans TaxID=878477 RepID=A0A812PEE6_9DINO|nr:unnamed protein product [Symbiodinium natans]